MKLQGRVALVTGASSGLGYAVTRRFAEAGVSIVAMARDKGRLDVLKSIVEPERLLIFAGSVAEEADVAAVLEKANERFGDIHIVVNCAGVAATAKTVSKAGPCPLELWNKVIATNLTGTFNVIRLAASRMVANAPDEEGERGVIITTSSGAAWQGQIGQAAYSASKAGVMGLTLPVARDLAPHGVRVVDVAPGLFETAMVDGIPQQALQATIDRIMLFPRRMGRAHEYAALVQTVVENNYLNATTISLDAGARTGSR